MKGAKAIVGVFTYLDDTLHAIENAKQKGYEIEVYAPTYIHELEHAVDKKRSPVAAVSLTGALIGLTFGFTLAILCGMDWPLRVSAKDIVAIPSYVVIGYECTILFGAIFTLKALLFFCKLPNIFRRAGYDPRFSDDKFGVVIGCDNQQVADAQHLLSSAGADEVQVRDGL